MSLVVKYQGASYPIDMVEGETVDAFKSRLSLLTQLPSENMKLVYKGKTITNDFPVMKLPAVLMLLGSATALPPAPKASTVSDSHDIAKPAAAVTPGLVNLGNTCYMNATLQCLSAIPELSAQLLKVPIPSQRDNQQTVAFCLGTLFADLKRSSSSVSPMLFLTAFRAAFPQFAEADSHGYKQQDAEECWSQLITVLSDHAPGLDSDTKFIDQFMKGEFTVTMKCKEANDEQESFNIESFNKMQVHIGAGYSTTMHADILKSLDEDLEKNSESLGRSAVYTKSSRISRLPAYLVTSFIRFQWKQSEGLKAKILKKVKFPFQLDASEFCTPALKESTQALREKLITHQKNNLELKSQKLPLLAFDAGEFETGSNPTAIYTLVAVLTHAGRSSDSGHYIGWVKRGEAWIKYDDDKIDGCDDEDIKRLEGGGEAHGAYICLYKSTLE